MIHLSTLNAERGVQIGRIAADFKFAEEIMSPRQLVTNADFKNLETSLEFSSPGNWDWEVVAYCAVAFPEKRLELLEKATRLNFEAFQRRYEVTVWEPNDQALLEHLSQGRVLFPEHHRWVGFDHYQHEQLFTEVEADLISKISNGKYIEFLTLASARITAFPGLKFQELQLDEEQLEGLLGHYENARKEVYRDNGFLAKLRLLFPDFTPTPAMIKFQEQKVKELKNDGLEVVSLWEHIYYYAVMVAERVDVNEKGIHLQFSTHKAPDTQVKLPPRKDLG